MSSFVRFALIQLMAIPFQLFKISLILSDVVAGCLLRSSIRLCAWVGICYVQGFVHISFHFAISYRWRWTARICERKMWLVIHLMQFYVLAVFSSVELIDSCNWWTVIKTVSSVWYPYLLDDNFFKLILVLENKGTVRRILVDSLYSIFKTASVKFSIFLYCHDLSVLKTDQFLDIIEMSNRLDSIFYKFLVFFISKFSFLVSIVCRCWFKQFFNII